MISRITVITVPAAGLPDAADLDAYAVTDDDTVYFSTDVTVDLGGLLVSPGDVVRVDPGGAVSLEIAAAGLGLRADTDAVTLTGDPARPLARLVPCRAVVRRPKESRPSPEGELTPDDSNMRLESDLDRLPCCGRETWFQVGFSGQCGGSSLRG